MGRVRLTYLLATLALFVALPCLFGVLIPGPTATGTWIVLLVAGSIAAAFLVQEARRDSYPFAQYALVALLFPLTFAVAAYVCAESGEGRARAIGAGAVCLLGITAAVAALWREHQAKDALPNYLAERFDVDHIFETDGVHWAVERGPAEVAEGALVEIWLQNCVAAERVVDVALESVTGLLKRRGALVTSRIEPIRLGSGEVGKLWVPVGPGPRPAREARLYFSVRARGPRGRRLRKLRGKASSERATLGFQLFALLGGHLVWGGGVWCVFENARETAGEAPGTPKWHPFVG